VIPTSSPLPRLDFLNIISFQHVLGVVRRDIDQVLL
jgi:hypothetical protein